MDLYNHIGDLSTMYRLRVLVCPGVFRIYGVFFLSMGLARVCGGFLVCLYFLSTVCIYRLYSANSSVPLSGNGVTNKCHMGWVRYISFYTMIGFVVCKEALHTLEYTYIVPYLMLRHWAQRHLCL